MRLKVREAPASLISFQLNVVLGAQELTFTDPLLSARHMEHSFSWVRNGGLPPNVGLMFTYMPEITQEAGQGP